MTDAELEAKIAATQAKIAELSAPKVRKTRGSLSRKAKAQALVDWFIVDSLKEAYAYLEDMGE